MLEAGQIGKFNRIVLKTGYTDLRCGIPTLTEILTNFYGVDFRDEGVLYLFCGTKCNKIKGLCSLNVKAVSKDAYDGQGKTQCPVTRCH